MSKRSTGPKPKAGNYSLRPSVRERCTKEHHRPHIEGILKGFGRNGDSSVLKKRLNTSQVEALASEIAAYVAEQFVKERDEFTQPETSFPP